MTKAPKILLSLSCLLAASTPLCLALEHSPAKQIYVPASQIPRRYDSEMFNGTEAVPSTNSTSSLYKVPTHYANRLPKPRLPLQPWVRFTNHYRLRRSQSPLFIRKALTRSCNKQALSFSQNLQLSTQTHLLLRASWKMLRLFWWKCKELFRKKPNWKTKLHK